MAELLWQLASLPGIPNHQGGKAVCLQGAVKGSQCSGRDSHNLTSVFLEVPPSFLSDKYARTEDADVISQGRSHSRIYDRRLIT